MTLNVRTAAVRADGLSRRYGATRALDDVDLTLERGITGLLGPNGAGKTTLLSILATVSEPDAGRVSVFGLDPRQAAQRVEIRRRLGYLPQELGYHRHFTVAAFLDYVAILKEITDRRRRAEEVARVLAAVGLESRARTRIRALSGGMRQRLGIAQALLGHPDLLVLDEPTAGLDPEQRLRFRELLSGLPGDPVIVLSTHQADDIAAICPHVVVLLQGQVHFAGTPAELAATAAGRVWAADERDDRAHLAWRGGDNRWRHVGEDPPARRRTGRADGRGRVPAAVPRGRFAMTAAGGGPALPSTDTPARTRDDGGPGVPATRAPRLRTVLGLAQVEASLLVRSLLVLAGLVGGGGLIWLTIDRTEPLWWSVSWWIGAGQLILGMAVLIAAQLAAGRPRRDWPGRSVRELPDLGHHPHRRPPGRPGGGGARQPAAGRRRHRRGAGPRRDRHAGPRRARGRGAAGDRDRSGRGRDRHPVIAPAGRGARRAGAVPLLRGVSSAVGRRHLAGSVGNHGEPASVAAWPAGRVSGQAHTRWNWPALRFWPGSWRSP